MGAPTPVQRPLVFALNGQRVEITSVDPATTLLSYIRTATPFKGTKRGCGEGGCGACVVALSRYNPDTKEVKQSTINSCLVLLCSIDGCAITTTEGLGNQRDGLHSIHKRLSAFHGSQCGYCTPGMTMAIYGCLKHDQQKQAKHAATANGSHSKDAAPKSGLTSENLERAIGANICRCTGYRPILDTCKSFAHDVDLEDLGLNTCWADKSQAKHENLPPYDPTADPQFPKFMIAELEARESRKADLADTTASKSETLAAWFRHVESGKGGEETERVWVSAASLGEVAGALKALKGKGQEVKLVVGNTSSGIYKDMQPRVFVDISKIPELLAVRLDSQGLEIGAATRIAEFIELLEDFGPATGCKEPVAQALADHLKKLAGVHVRNWGSVGGNLVMAQQLSFDSDLATILLGAGASVKVVTVGNPQHIVASLSLEDFLAKGMLSEGSLLQSVYIPLDVTGAGMNNGTHAQNGAKTPISRTVFKTFRGAPRPFGNAVSYTNAAFLARVLDSGVKGTVVESARLAFGAFGTKHAIRAMKVEQLLKGKALTQSLLLESIELLKKEIVPAEGTTKREFRASLAVAFLFEFLNPLLSGEPTHVAPASLVPHIGKQLLTVTDERYPLNQPTSKFLSQLQASGTESGPAEYPRVCGVSFIWGALAPMFGEAIYVDDIPSPPTCLYGAFVLSSEPIAKIKGFDTRAALDSVGAVAYISVHDIPPGGKNVGINNLFTGEKEPVFADEIVGYVGESVGLLVADTYDNARSAARKVKVDYDTESVGAPIMTCEDAIARNSTYPSLVPQMRPIGDIEMGFAEADFQFEGEVVTKSQNHFYMETQTTMAVPDEDGCMTVYTSCQSPELTQAVIATCLNLPLHNIRVIIRRLGGSFGGKVLQNQNISVAVALAAYKLRRPVRISLDRNTDMQMIGGRSPLTAKFTVGFTKAGKITGLKVNLVVEGGWHAGVSPLLPALMMASMKKYDFGSFDIAYTVCKTNNVPKTTMRAPGEIQASLIADSVLDQVASYLGVSGDKVRDENLHTAKSITLFQGESAVGDVATGFTLPAMWHKIKASSKKDEREKEIARFNAQSRWLKRGLAMVPSVYSCFIAGNTATVSIFQDGSIVAEVGGVEMGQGLYTKVRQATAYSLSPLWTREQGFDMVSKIRVIQNDTLSLPNSSCDGGSTTSEGSCAAMQKACEVLVQRLLPIKEELAQGQPDGKVPWETLCSTARNRQIDMQSHERWTPTLRHYLLYGVGVSEVEVNILTGETRILAADLIYDCGKSLNPAIDIGQVEGAFVQGIGFLLTEEILRDAKGKLLSDGTWTYKPPTIDTIPQRFNVELFNSPVHKDRVFSSKASGEPPLLLAGSVFSATRNAIAAARKEYVEANAGNDIFRLDPPATMDKIKKLCGLDNVEHYLHTSMKRSKYPHGKMI